MQADVFGAGLGFESREGFAEEGFEVLGGMGAAVSIFGSARTSPENRYYQMAEQLAAELARRSTAADNVWSWAMTFEICG